MPQLTSTREIRDQFDSLSLEQAEVKVIASPSLMAYEAKFALQQIKDHVEDPAAIAEIIEPLARAVGWAEASAYVFDRLAVLGSVGTHVPTGNGGRQVGN